MKRRKSQRTVRWEQRKKVNMEPQNGRRRGDITVKAEERGWDEFASAISHGSHY
jgi:hypothetical protein